MTRLLISFSGGRTSAYMTHMLLRERTGDEIVVLFANTGCEHEKTLEFVRNCDERLGFCTTWIEAVPHPGERKGSDGFVVNFATASRNGEPFEAVIQKYGIPNPNFLHCTRELKMNPIHNWLRKHMGWKKGSYETAIGIRADEFDRMRSDAEKEKIIYPLVKDGVTKQDVLNFWRTMPFDLDLPEHLGNCTWCWKKSLRKHVLLAQESPEVFDFPRRMEALYHNAGPGTIDRPRRFFRKNRTVQDLFDLARAAQQIPQLELDQASSCNETCEIA